MPSEAINAAAPPPELVQTLISGLSAYGRLYGLPNSPEQVQGILGTLLRLHLPEQPAALVDAVAQQVLDGLTPEDLKNAIVSRASSALAKQAHRWQQQLGEKITGVMAAYVQRYAPALTPDTLNSMATAILPLVSDHAITRAEALGLVSQVVQTFDIDGAIATAINPVYLELAQTLATALSQKPMADAVGETVIAYVQKYAPTLLNIGADLISTALSAVLQNQVDFNIDTQLTIADEKLLIEQVSFQLNILQQQPTPSKAARAIASQVNTAVEQYLQDREGHVNVTTGLISGDGLSVSSPLTSSRRPPEGPST
ncbi:hypothetical protein [Nodosilinea nodulosa]|uniref:hypothetical protein n=1 Tax=Nodosilinea nodulosa TaxID=416001 RepID=UPI0002FACA33|nr:hypothetical protein [Nodosilinea nodulosa]